MDPRLIALLTIVATAASTTHAQPAEDGLRPWTENPRYWQYRGAPVMLMGGSKDDNLFQIPDLREHLELMAAIGANYIRNTMSDREDAGYEIKAYARGVDGRYDLDQWNDEYWQRFANMLAWTAELGIFVQIEVWDRFDHFGDNWQKDPFNPANNLNYTSEESGLDTSYPDHPGQNRQPFFFTTPAQRNNELLLGYQQRYVDQMLSRTLAYDHVLYCMDNETSGEEAWGAYWAEYIRAAAAARGRTVYLTEMWDDWNLTGETHRRTFDRPDRYDFCDVSQNNHQRGQQHWDNFQWARARVADPPRPLNTVKTYGADTGRYGTDADGIERWWRHLIGGAAAVRFHRPTSGHGLNEKAQAAIIAGRKLEQHIPLWTVEPALDLLGERAEDEAYLAARPGQAYALFAPRAADVTLDLSAGTGEFTVHWISVDTGEWGPRATVQGGGVVRIATPGEGMWAAAIVAAG